MSDCDQLIADFKMNARDFLHESTQLEVSTRGALLSTKVLQSLNILAADISRQEFVRYQFQTSVVNYTLTATEIAYQAASKLLGSVVWLAPLALSAS